MVPVETLAFYGALVLWAGFLLQGLRKDSWRNFTLVGVGLMLVLNIGYFVRGQGDAIAFFVSIYDLLDNLGVSNQGELPVALATCPDNACSIAQDFESHPAWGVAFHERFANGPTGRRTILFAHIAFNTVAFVLAHVPLLVVLLWLVSRDGPTALWTAATLDVFMVVHAGLHWRLSGRPEYEFSSVASRGLIYGTALVALAHLVLLVLVGWAR